MRLNKSEILKTGVELLKYGEYLEVLEPQWLRDEMAGRIQEMLDQYKED